MFFPQPNFELFFRSLPQLKDVITKTYAAACNFCQKLHAGNGFEANCGFQMNMTNTGDPTRIAACRDPAWYPLVDDGSQPLPKQVGPKLNKFSQEPSKIESQSMFFSHFEVKFNHF